MSHGRKPMVLSDAQKALARMKEIRIKELERRRDMAEACNELYRERMRRLTTPAVARLAVWDRAAVRYVVAQRLTWEAYVGAAFEERTAALRAAIYEQPKAYEGVAIKYNDVVDQGSEVASG